MSKPKILLWDMETLPMVKRCWSLWQQFGNYEEVIHDWSIICVSLKWKGKKKVHRFSLADDKKRLKANVRDDKHILERVMPFFEEADWAVAHNGDNFDFKKFRARLAIHGLKPSAPVKQYDTLKVARARFAFSSNKLDDLAQMLGGPRKIKTEYSLWTRCEAGEIKAINEMGTYCDGDIVSLEGVYDRLAPFDNLHPNWNIPLGTDMNCVSCGSSNIQRRGSRVTRVNKFQRFQCQDCGAWGSLPLSGKGRLR